MTNLIVVGSQWGDEGKGKIVDLLSDGSLVDIPDIGYPLNVKYGVDVRYNGAHNAGHTVRVGDETYKLHHIPSGIVSGKECIIGNGLAVNPKILIKEIEDLEKRGISTDKLCLSSKAHVILPYHETFDGIGGKKIGTTKMGVGPAYEDKSARRGIRVEDLLLSEDELCEKIEAALEDKNFLLENKYGEEPFNPRELAKEYAEYGKRLGKYVSDTPRLLKDFMNEGLSVIFEGAQGTYLDIDHGTYPFVTSSNSTAGNACTGSGIGPLDIDYIIGVAKAYVTRVGNGPFPTELGDSESEEFKKERQGDKFTEDKIREMIASGDDYLIGKAIRLRGVEYGTTTGRPRRVGYPDFVMLLYSRDINSIRSWAVTKMDVLGDIEFRVATKYVNEDGILVPEYSGKKYGWETIGEEDKERMVRDGFDSMHGGMKEYLIDLANFTKTPVSFGSISPERRHTVTRKVLERTSQYL